MIRLHKGKKNLRLSMRTIAAGLTVSILTAGMFIPKFSSAQEARFEIANVQLQEEAFNFQPHVEFDQILLTIAGPYQLQLRRVLRDEKSFKFELVDDFKEPLPDGQYSYELRVIPKIPSRLRDSLREIRESGDERALYKLRREGILSDEPQTQTGYFTILGGKIVDPSKREETDRSSS